MREQEELVNSATKWAFDMELLDSPGVLNTLYINIYATSRLIKDVEILTDMNVKKMLIFIELKWIHFVLPSFKKNITAAIENNLMILLPRYKIRIIFNREIFNKSLYAVNNKLTGDEK